MIDENYVCIGHGPTLSLKLEQTVNFGIRREYVNTSIPLHTMTLLNYHNHQVTE